MKSYVLFSMKLLILQLSLNVDGGTDTNEDVGIVRSDTSDTELSTGQPLHVTKIKIGNNIVLDKEAMAAFIALWEQIKELSKSNQTSIETNIQNNGNGNKDGGVVKLKGSIQIGQPAKVIIDHKLMTMWPMGLVPYYIDPSSYDDLINNRLLDAMKVLEADSCVKFQQLKFEPSGNGSWLYIANPNKERECVHHTTTDDGNGRKLLVLGLDCLKSRDILHSLLHGVGFHDEVAHPSRGSYVRIVWENIRPEYRHLYNIKPTNSPVEYDPRSIMHFHDCAYSKNGEATVEPLLPGLTIKPSKSLSQLDKLKLRLMFGQECNRRQVVDLVDTCGRVLKGHTEPYDSNGSGAADDKNEIPANTFVNDDNADANGVINLPECLENQVPSIENRHCYDVPFPLFQNYEAIINEASSRTNKTKLQLYDFGIGKKK